jgi:hypothetical protein
MDAVISLRSGLDKFDMVVFNPFNALWQVHGPHGLWWKPPETGAFPFLDENFTVTFGLSRRILPYLRPEYVGNPCAKRRFLNFVNAMVDQTASFCGMSQKIG